MNGHGYICVGWLVLKGILLYNRMLYTHILEGFILWLLTLRLLHHQYLFSSSFYSHSRNRLDRLTLDNSISGPTANASAQVVYSTAASNRATQSNALVRYGNLCTTRNHTIQSCTRRWRDFLEADSESLRFMGTI